VQPRCTCGALLPEDARFCHKCGKPQYEEDIARLSVPEVLPLAETAVPREPGRSSPLLSAPSAISFRNLRAVGTTLSVAAVSLVALGIAGEIGASPLLLIILCAAGFVAARFYHRRTAERLTPLAGAKLGAMTCLWLFLVIAIGAIVNFSTMDGREKFKTAILNAPNLPNVPEFTKLLQDPSELMVLILVSFAFLFLIGTVAAAFGGMLAARLLPRDGQSS
jgi:hypothetical protein